MKTAIIVVAMAVLAVGWIKWKVTAMAFIYYIEKSQYKQPDRNDIKECIDFVVENMLKDLTKGKKGK